MKNFLVAIEKNCYLFFNRKYSRQWRPSNVQFMQDLFEKSVKWRELFQALCFSLKCVMDHHLAICFELAAGCISDCCIVDMSCFDQLVHNIEVFFCDYDCCLWIVAETQIEIISAKISMHSIIWAQFHSLSLNLIPHLSKTL